MENFKLSLETAMEYYRSTFFENYKSNCEFFECAKMKKISESTFYNWKKTKENEFKSFKKMYSKGLFEKYYLKNDYETSDEEDDAIGCFPKGTPQYEKRVVVEATPIIPVEVVDCVDSICQELEFMELENQEKQNTNDDDVIDPYANDNTPVEPIDDDYIYQSTAGGDKLKMEMLEEKEQREIDKKIIEDRQNASEDRIFCQSCDYEIQNLYDTKMFNNGNEDVYVCNTCYNDIDTLKGYVKLYFEKCRNVARCVEIEVNKTKPKNKVVDKNDKPIIKTKKGAKNKNHNPNKSRNDDYNDIYCKCIVWNGGYGGQCSMKANGEFGMCKTHYKKCVPVQQKLVMPEPRWWFGHIDEGSKNNLYDTLNYDECGWEEDTAISSLPKTLFGDVNKSTLNIKWKN